VPKNLEEIIARCRGSADIGIAFDGDADRIGWWTTRERSCSGPDPHHPRPRRAEALPKATIIST